MKKQQNIQLNKKQPRKLQDFVDYSVRNYDDMGRLLSNVMKHHTASPTSKSK